MDTMSETIVVLGSDVMILHRGSISLPSLPGGFEDETIPSLAGRMIHLELEIDDVDFEAFSGLARAMEPRVAQQVYICAAERVDLPFLGRVKRGDGVTPRSVRETMRRNRRHK